MRRLVWDRPLFFVFARLAAGGRYPVPRRFCPLFLLQMPTGHLPRRICGIFLPGRRLVSHSAQEKMPFSAPNASGAPSAQDLGRFSARQAGGIPFCAGKDTFFCFKYLRGTFRAGFGAFSCPADGWYPILRRKNAVIVFRGGYAVCREGRQGVRG